MKSRIFFLSALFVLIAPSIAAQYSSGWDGAPLDTLTSGNSDETNPSLQIDEFNWNPVRQGWLSFERHTSAATQVAAKRFFSGSRWDTATAIISSSPKGEQRLPHVYGLRDSPQTVLVAWEKIVGKTWNIYYSIGNGDSLKWSTHKALTSDSVDCTDIRVATGSDSSFAVFWKRKSSICYALLRVGIQSAVYTAASSNFDSVEYDIYGNNYSHAIAMIYTAKDTSGRRCLWSKRFAAWPDTTQSFLASANTSSLNVLHPRILQGWLSGNPWFLFEAYTGMNRDLWINTGTLENATLTPSIDERNCTAYFYPIVTHEASLRLSGVFNWMQSVYEIDSSIILNPGANRVTTPALNRSPVIAGYVFPEIIGSGYRIVAAWEGYNNGRWHIYSKNIFHSNGSVQRTSMEPAGFSLSPNYPNPFNPSTAFQFSIPDERVVTIKIFDALGREVETLVHEKLSGGSYTSTWNASRCSGGIYFIALAAGTYSRTNKIVLLR